MAAARRLELGFRSRFADGEDTFLRGTDVEGAGPGGGISGGGSDVELLTQRVRHAGPTRQRRGERDRLGGGLGCGLLLLLLGSAHWPFLFSFFLLF